MMIIIIIIMSAWCIR